MKNRTILYGYCCNNGRIAAHPQESVIVDSICREYIDGKSLLTIATRLNDEQIEYMPGITGWNKARLKRILEDERYLGKEPYPRTIPEEVFSQIQAIKHNRNTQKGTDRQSDIYQINIPTLCPKCRSKMKRIYAGKRKCKTKWYCSNEECKCAIGLEDDDMLVSLTDHLNTLIANPDIIRAYEPAPTEPSMELRRLNNEVARMLDSTDIDRETARAKMLECLSQKYQEIDTAEYTTKRLVADLTNAETLTAFSADLLGRVADAVILHTDQSVSIILTNGQIIGKEIPNGTNHATAESGQSYTAYG